MNIVSLHNVRFGSEAVVQDDIMRMSSFERIADTQLHINYKV